LLRDHSAVTVRRNTTPSGKRSAVSRKLLRAVGGPAKRCRSR